jgi:hypothetical protein
MTSPESILPGPYIQLATALGGAILAATWLSLILWTARDIRARCGRRAAHHPRLVPLPAPPPCAYARGGISIQPGRRSADLGPRRADDLPRLRPAGGTRLADLPGLLDRPAQTLHRLRADARSHLERVPVLRNRDRRQGNRGIRRELVNRHCEERSDEAIPSFLKSEEIASLPSVARNDLAYPNPPFVNANFPA